MTKFRKSFIAIFFVAIIFLFYLKFIGFYKKEDSGFIGFFGRLLNSTNEFQITYHNIDKNDIDVHWSSDEYSEVLVENGLTKSNFGYVYGPEQFIVFYKNDTLCMDGFFSTNNNDVYDVKIDVSKTSNGFIVTYFFNVLEELTKVEVSIDSNGIKKQEKSSYCIN